ncbi:MAG: hypothetical protein ACLPYS_00865 [Vulcanimicrobiaceae bacterium]|jgi:hypothetical protein
MPRYVPLEITPTIIASHSDLAAFHWVRSGIVADFIIPRASRSRFRVAFERAEIVRILDEMTLSTESEATPNDGLVKEHFGYFVEGAAFFNHQSEAFKQVFKAVKHYRFITGWTCLDVISSCEPRFSEVHLEDRDVIAG